MSDRAEVEVAPNASSCTQSTVGDASNTDSDHGGGGGGGRVLCRKSAIGQLTQADRDAMYSLFQRHYDRTDRNRFERDLNAKRWVLRLFDSDTLKLCGFSTQTVMRMEHGGRIIRVLFSGDTIIDPAYWGETALIRHWGRMVAELIKVDASQPLYWFLISKGYKTYRFLSVFFREYYPRLDCETPSDAKSLIDALGSKMFPSDYDARRGIVVATREKDRLRAELAMIEPSRLADPHIRFFLERNPNHCRGDELCCLAPLEFRNFTAAGIRLLDAKNQQYARQDRAING